MIDRRVAIRKLEYVLLAIFDLVNRHDTLKASCSLDALRYGLFTCPLLDVFFPNLAVGARLVT